MEHFFEKALREAKAETSWDNPNQPYETACRGFARALLERTPNPFLADFAEFAARAGFFAMLGGISQTVLRLTVPGVPDTYQGGETWNYSLVDPDNRAPVDFARCRDALDAERGDIGDRVPDMAAGWPDGRIKLHLTATLLRLRRELAALFVDGGYEPLSVEEPGADRVVAFARARGDDVAVICAGRLFIGVLGWNAARYDPAAWRGTALSWPADFRGRWRDVLTGRIFDPGGAALEQLFAALPACVLVRERP
jgi:(1->4)-alpha-D-glucan 1-alpha-D-glucosylmutase